MSDKEALGAAHEVMLAVRDSFPRLSREREALAVVSRALDELEAEVARLREERDEALQWERESRGVVDPVYTKKIHDLEDRLSEEEAEHCGQMDALVAERDEAEADRDAALARAEEEAANVQKVSALLAAEERQHMKLQHEIVAVAKGDAMHCDANSNLLGIREELLALRARAEAAERDALDKGHRIPVILAQRDQAESALAAERERTKVVAVCAHCKGDIRVCQGRTENGDGVWKHLHCALLETLAAERAKRCGTCADAEYGPNYPIDTIGCVSVNSECCGRVWSVIHGCPHWRAKEEA